MQSIFHQLSTIRYAKIIRAKDMEIASMTWPVTNMLSEKRMMIMIVLALKSLWSVRCIL